MKAIRTVIGTAVVIAALGDAAPAGAQYVVCCNLPINVNGPWIGTSRSPQVCTDNMKRDVRIRRYVCNTLRALGAVCDAIVDVCKDIEPGPPGEPPGSTSPASAPASGSRASGGGATPATRPAPSESERMPPGPLAFLLDLDTAGGFTGRGRGRATIASDGAIHAARAGTTCEARLRAEELESLTAFIADAVKEPWPPAAVPDDDGCCDRIKWTLRLRRRDGTAIRTYVTSWYDGNEPNLRKDLGEVGETASVLMQKTLLNCQRD